MKNTNKNELTNTMIELMKTAGNDWKKSWASNGINKNSDGIAYTGMNQLRCMITSSNKGYSSNIWWTYAQLLKKFGAGKFDVKGEKATTLIKPFKKTDKETGEDLGITFKPFNVFNQSQVRDCQFDNEATTTKIFNDITNVENFVNSLNATIKHGGDQAFYKPSEDYIQIPEKTSFDNEISYYGTLLHELVHWTKKDNRSGRKQSKNRKEYAYEELIAELGSVFLCAEFGIETTPRIDHAQYLNGWIKALNNDTKILINASNEAWKACQWLIEESEGKQIKLVA